MRLYIFIPVVIFLISNFEVIGQNQAEKVIIKNGSIEPLVQLTEGISPADGYKKLNEWVNYNYKNADAVIGSSIENKFLRFTGITPNFATSFGYVYDLEYTIRVEFKDGKYRLTVEQLRSGNNGIFATFDLDDYYKSNGEPRKAYQSFTDGIEESLNRINLSIFKYLTSQTEKADGNW